MGPFCNSCKIFSIFESQPEIADFCLQLCYASIFHAILYLFFLVIIPPKLFPLNVWVTIPCSLIALGTFLIANTGQLTVKHSNIEISCWNHIRHPRISLTGTMLFCFIFAGLMFTLPCNGNNNNNLKKKIFTLFVVEFILFRQATCWTLGK